MESGEENPYITMGSVDNEEEKLTKNEKEELKALRKINESSNQDLNKEQKSRLKALGEKEGQRKYKAYYEETDEKNYSEIVVPFKRYDRKQLIRAVKSQLLYFEGIKFKYVEEDGYERKVPFKAEILHNSSSLLISDTSRFSRPHVIIVKDKDQKTGVCYGAIDFKRMEMESLYGSVGFKCPIRSVIEDPETGKKEVVQEGVSVTPRICWAFI